jgi:hypothetical protein
MPRTRNPAISLFVGCLAFFFAGNGLTSLLMSGETSSRAIAMTLWFVCTGMIGGQIALHSIWCVFAPLHWAKRFFVGTTSAIVLFGGLMVPLFLAEGFDLVVVADLAAPLLCLPLFLLAAQTPLWIMQMWFTGCCGAAIDPGQIAPRRANAPIVSRRRTCLAATGSRDSGVVWPGRQDRAAARLPCFGRIRPAGEGANCCISRQVGYPERVAGTDILPRLSSFGIRPMSRDNRQKRDLHALNADGMVLCNPRDKEAAHRAEMERIATHDRTAVTCRKCLALLYELEKARQEGR